MNPLTEREMDVARLVAEGLGDKEIGNALGISFLTVRNHLKHAREKLNLTNRTQLAMYTVRNGFMPCPQ